MKRHVTLTAVLLLLGSGCGASAPSAQTLQTAQRATRLGLDIGACVRFVIERKLDPERTTGLIAACVDDAVSRDLAAQAVLAEVSQGVKDGETTTAQ